MFSLSNKLKKLKLGSEESLTPRKFPELRVKAQSFELLVCVRDHIQSLNLLIKQKLKKKAKLVFFVYVFHLINLFIYNDSILSLLS